MVKYRNLKHKWIDVTEDKALEIAKRLWRLAKDETTLQAINNRFDGIKFTRNELNGKPKEIYDRDKSKS